MPVILPPFLLAPPLPPGNHGHLRWGGVEGGHCGSCAHGKGDVAVLRSLGGLAGWGQVQIGLYPCDGLGPPGPRATADDGVRQRRHACHFGGFQTEGGHSEAGQALWGAAGGC